MKIIKKRFLVIATAAVVIPVLAVLGRSASADPTNPPGPRQLAGVGSDTTEEVLNDMSETILVNGLKPVASYNATGGGFSTKSTTNCNYAAYEIGNGPGIRANGGLAGRGRLLDALNPGDPRSGCLDFARSSHLDLRPASTDLVYIPFALDTLTYAIRDDSTTSRRLSEGALTSIYQCAGSTSDNFLPLLPQSGSGSRAVWLAMLGLTETTKGACVRDTYVDPSDGRTKPVQDNNGRALVDRKNIVPYSAAQYSAQSVGSIPDVSGAAVLGAINGIPPLAASVGARGAREVYNIVPFSRLGTQPTNQVFVGPNSEVCKQTRSIFRNGFNTVANCGDTSRQTG